MKTEQFNITENSQSISPNKVSAENVDLVFCFGNKELMQNNSLTSVFPNADIVGCTTAGAILSDELFDQSLCVTAVDFEKSTTEVYSANTLDHADSFTLGKHLAKSISHENLVHAFIISETMSVNGTQLVKGISKHLPAHVRITGGMAADDENFKETHVWHNEVTDKPKIVIIGFYGEHIKIGAGSSAGWNPFGPDRLVTRSEGNILYELDGQPALDVYKKYTGDANLNNVATAVRFPLRTKGKDIPETILTVLKINEQDGSLVYGGDIEQGSTVQLMKTNMNHLIDSVVTAAERAQISGIQNDELAILVSCVGRRMVLKQSVEEELEYAIETIENKNLFTTGFYSYGEIAPTEDEKFMALHNQTMAITTIGEI